MKTKLLDEMMDNLYFSPNISVSVIKSLISLDDDDCITYEGEKKYVQNCGLETRTEKTSWEVMRRSECNS
jgi:hypothetical protein